MLILLLLVPVYWRLLERIEFVPMLFSRDILVRLEDALISVRLRPVTSFLIVTALRLLLFEFTPVPEDERREDAEERVPLSRKEDEVRLTLLRKEDAERVPLEAIELREPEER